MFAPEKGNDIPAHLLLQDMLLISEGLAVALDVLVEI